MTATLVPVDQRPPSGAAHRNRADRRSHRPRSLRATVVGLLPDVDGAAALAWAAQDARRADSRLLVLDCLGARHRGRDSARGHTIVEQIHAADAVSARLRCVLGAPADAVVAAGDGSRLVVLGRRGERLSTDAVTVLRRLTRPAVIVPDAWDVAVPRRDVVLDLGAVADHLQPAQERAVTTALVMAVRRAAPLTVLADWAPFTTGRDRRAVLTRFRAREDLVREALRDLAARHPQVRVHVTVPVSDRVTRVLEHAGEAELVVLSRDREITTWELADRSPVPTLLVP
jgi:hypothetical protein